jgi:hypothetical protein
MHSALPKDHFAAAAEGLLIEDAHSVDKHYLGARC